MFSCLVSGEQNRLQVIKPPSPPASPTAAGAQPGISSLACARLGDGTRYLWRMTAGSLGPGLAGMAGKSAFMCPFNKAQEMCVPPLGKKMGRKPHAARQASGQGGQAARQRGFLANLSRSGAEFSSDNLSRNEFQ